jgi:hypothetical protein
MREQLASRLGATWSVSDGGIRAPDGCRALAVIAPPDAAPRDSRDEAEWTAAVRARQSDLVEAMRADGTWSERVLLPVELDGTIAIIETEDER